MYAMWVRYVSGDECEMIVFCCLLLFVTLCLSLCLFPPYFFYYFSYSFFFLFLTLTNANVMALDVSLLTQIVCFRDFSRPRFFFSSFYIYIFFYALYSFDRFFFIDTYIFYKHDFFLYIYVLRRCVSIEFHKCSLLMNIICHTVLFLEI